MTFVPRVHSYNNDDKADKAQDADFHIIGRATALVHRVPEPAFDARPQLACYACIVTLFRLSESAAAIDIFGSPAAFATVASAGLAARHAEFGTRGAGSIVFLHKAWPASVIAIAITFAAYPSFVTLLAFLSTRSKCIELSAADAADIFLLLKSTLALFAVLLPARKSCFFA